MKALWWILGIATAGTGIALIVKSRMPQISLENVDYIAKSVDFQMSAGGIVFNGTKLFKDKETSEKTEGAYKFLVSAEGPGFVLMILKDSKPVKATLVNLTTQTIETDLTKILALAT